MSEQKRITVSDALEKIGFDRCFDFLFDKLSTVGILERMTLHLEDKKRKLLEIGDEKQSARANRMLQILIDAHKRCEII